MRIVQSFWSRNKPDAVFSAAGWLSMEYMLMSWALSCSSLSRFFDDIVLYTDSPGAKLLIDELSLPYTEVVCDLDRLNTFHQDLWAISKIDVYSRQTKPFLHVDGDVFIWKKFDDGLLAKPLIAQNLEIGTAYSKTMFAKLKRNLSDIPAEMQNELDNESITSYNAGILGGTDVKFYERFAEKSMTFVKKNLGRLKAIDISSFNVFYEQYLFACMTRNENRHVDALFEMPFEDNKYRGFAEFIDVPYVRTYIHLIGTYKLSSLACRGLAERLRCEFPHLYYNIIDFFRRRKFPLHRDYYWFENSDDLKCRLLERYAVLKKTPLNAEIVPSGSSEFLRKQRQNSLSIRSHLIWQSISQCHGLVDEISLNEFIESVKRFEANLSSIIETMLNNISDDYIYAMDLRTLSYLETLFSPTSNPYEVIVAAVSEVELVSVEYEIGCLYNVQEDVFVSEKVLRLICNPPDNFVFAVIPECDSVGYAVLHLDRLDVLICNYLKASPMRVAELFGKVASHFSPSDVSESSAEFEKLMFHRIKLAIYRKLLKII